MIWHVVIARAGERSHALVHDFLDGHQKGRHGIVCYCREVEQTSLPPDVMLDHLKTKLELAILLGQPLAGNNLRGFKWTRDIRRTFPFGFSVGAAKLLSPPRGEPTQCPIAELPGS